MTWTQWQKDKTWWQMWLDIMFGSDDKDKEKEKSK